jgi:hypothetical protein
VVEGRGDRRGELEIRGEENGGVVKSGDYGEIRIFMVKGTCWSTVIYFLKGKYVYFYRSSSTVLGYAGCIMEIGSI